jgi:S-methylmethionine-dependent homocysteine/selenocysteine methylase
MQDPAEWIKAGANIIGGGCRTGPEHIAQLRKLVDEWNRSRPC